MNIFLAQSPLQVLSATEAREHMGAHDDHIFIMLSPTKNNNNLQILETLRKTGWKNIHTFKPVNSSPTHNLIGKLKLFHSIYLLARFGIDNLFIGDFLSIWMNRARAISAPANTWLLDDGVVTSYVQRHYFNKNIYWPPHRKGLLQRYTRALTNIIYGSRAVSQKVIHIFSAFSVDQPANSTQRVIKHNYEHLQEIIPDKKIIGNALFFLGSKLSEAGILNHQYEVSSIIRIAREYKSIGIEFIYISHRGDKSLKLDAIKSAGVSVKSLDMPIELFFALSNEMPAHIATFCSSAMNNLTAMYQFTSKTAFIVPQAEITQKSHSAFEVLYSDFHNSGIKLIKIDELLP